MRSIILWCLLLTVCFSADEKQWQKAWNDKIIKGVLEYRVSFGRIDILTKNYAIEIDHVHKFHEGIGQALHYAYATNRKPGLALFMDGKQDTFEEYQYAKKLAEHYGIKVWLMNEAVSLNSKPIYSQRP